MVFDPLAAKMKMPTAGVILAAGMSTRMGTPKQFIKLGDKTLLEIAVNAAVASQLETVVVVLGHEFEAASTLLSGTSGFASLIVVNNTDVAQGMSRSLHLGLSMVHESFPSVMFLSADQPLVTSPLINSLLDRFWSSDKDICIPFAGGRKGPPTIFSRRYFPDLFNVEGDKGGRDVIGTAADDVLAVELEDPTCLMDIDTPADLVALKALAGSA